MFLNICMPIGLPLYASLFVRLESVPIPFCMH